MNIKIHLIISNLLQILYVIVNSLGVVLGIFNADKIVLLNMIWYMVILLVYIVDFIERKYTFIEEWIKKYMPILINNGRKDFY